MIAPDVEVEGKGIILISSEEGETEGNNDKFLKDLGIVDGSILTCDDFLQSYTLKVSQLIHFVTNPTLYGFLHISGGWRQQSSFEMFCPHMHMIFFHEM
jgi:hypothetical protein